MNTPPAPRDDDDILASGGAGKVPGPGGSGPAEDVETYHIPGGLRGWVPGEIPVDDPQFTAKMRRAQRNETPPPVRPTDDLDEDVAAEDVPARRATARVKRPTFPLRAPGWALAGYNLLVFISSVCVMTLELTASRLIAKHIGSSLYTWTSVIGVVLAGITMGNFLGGVLADRFQRRRTLAWMFFLSSVACASVLWMDQVVARMPRPDYFSWPSWVLCVVSMMFLLPALLLGTTSPLVASMALERSTRTGTTVGNVYAWGAFGSIVGTFLTGFYLVDVWGTRAIIGLTAATLAILAITVAGSQRVFRAAVVVGWLQLLGFVWLAATMTGASMEAVAGTYGRAVAVLDSEPYRVHTIAGWSSFGDRLGQKLHELGLLLELRDDTTTAYHDESSYSYIQVRDDFADGVPIRALRLDHLDHSYYEPAQPTALHYEYEQIYAAVTKHAAPRGTGEVVVPLPEFPGRAELVQQLPAGFRFDEGRQQLIADGPTPAAVESLRNLSSSAAFWDAIDLLHRETTQSNWGGFATASLESLPEGITIPAELHEKIRYDSGLEALSAYDTITADDAVALQNLSLQAPWLQAIRALRRQSAPISTLFIGGGGFIFPRWVLTEFPGAERIDVAELDPAVYQAVRKEMGFTEADELRIRTHLGDARNFVEDRVRANQRESAAGQSPVVYDFIYGDAFNDFSVPWHLTTREFTEKLRSLLTPNGVFLANIIEIMPRTEVPGRTADVSGVSLKSTAPEALYNDAEPGQARSVQSRYSPLEVVGGTQLRYRGRMSELVEVRLLALAPGDVHWNAAVVDLASKSRQKQGLSEPLPDVLTAAATTQETWQPLPAPFEGVEIYRLADGGVVLGLRGVVTEALEQRLVDLKPSDAKWKQMIEDGAARSRRVTAGRFLGRYVQTMTAVFPHVSLFCTSSVQPGAERDTFVVACSLQPLNLKDLAQDADWTIRPFAEYSAEASGGEPRLTGQMAALLALADGKILTDDFAPVDNLLLPVFVRQDQEE